MISIPFCNLSPAPERRGHVEGLAVDPAVNGVSLIPIRPGEGRLTEPMAAIQPWRRELVFMPYTCRSRYPPGSAQLRGKLPFAGY